MAVALSAWPKFHAFDTNGNPLAFGKLYTYQAGTSTPLATYTDSTGSVPNPNPIILDSRGEANVWLLIGSAYKFTLNDSANALIWTVDNILATPQGTPALIAPSFTTVPGMQTTLDPGEVGSEVVPTSLEQQFQQVYHVLKEMKGTAQWYESVRTKFIVPQVSWNHVTPGILGWRDAQTDTAYFTFPVPYDYHSGPLTLKVYRRAAVTGQTAVMAFVSTRFRETSTPVTIDAGFAVDFTPALNNATSLQPYVINITFFSFGDFIRCDLTRNGTAGGDTMTSNVAFDGAVVEYTAFASR
jgi:hypothetical protein